MAEISHTDPQFMMDLTNKFLKMIDDVIKSRPDLMDAKEREFQEIMKKYIGQGNEPMTIIVDKDKYLEFTQYCKDHNLPYTIMGYNEKQEPMFAFRAEDADEIRKACELISLNDPNYASRCTPAEIAHNLVNSSEEFGYVISPKFDEDMTSKPEIIKAKLYDCGISSSNTNEKICLSAYAAMNSTGKDLNQFNLEMSVKNVFLYKGHSFLPNATEYAKVYASQKMYDDSELTKFIRECKKGNKMMICNAFDTAKSGYITFDYQKKVIEVIDAQRKTIASIPLKGSEQEIKALLFKHADKIHNMTLVNPIQFKELKQLNTTEQRRREICHRPRLNEELNKIKKSEDMTRALVDGLNIIATQETLKMVKDKDMSKHEIYQHKKDILVAMLKGTYKNEEAANLISIFKEKDDEVFGAEASQVHDNIVNKLTECFEKDNGNLYVISREKVSEIAKITDSAKFINGRNAEIMQHISELKQRRAEITNELNIGTHATQMDKETAYRNAIENSNLPDNLKNMLNQRDMESGILALNKIKSDPSATNELKTDIESIVEAKATKEMPLSEIEIEDLNEEKTAIDAQISTYEMQIVEIKQEEKQADYNIDLDAE